MSKHETRDYQQIFLHDHPLIDVRAPIEFAMGAFPLSTNLPLLDDPQRKAVGICYKQRGKDAAIELGHQLIKGDVRQSRLAAWQQFCHHHPQGYIYCLRGGLRSHIVQQWLHESGVDYPLIMGGYKALRNYLIDVIRQVANMPLWVVSGHTGCGKTGLILELSNGIDLEGAARHRGSSFGRTLEQQSNQVDFENRLAITLLKKQVFHPINWVIEDEGRNIACNHIPLELYQAMSQSPVVVIEEPLQQRLARLQQEYIEQMRAGFEQRYGAEIGWIKFSDYLQQGIYAIRKRLGSERYAQLSASIQAALQQQLSSNQSDGHLNWLSQLLNEYYDPMYTYQLDKKKQRIVFSGEYAAVKAYLMAKTEFNPSAVAN